MDTRSRCATVRDGQVPLSKLLLIAEFALRVDHVDQAGDVLDVLGGANQVRAHVRKCDVRLRTGKRHDFSRWNDAVVTGAQVVPEVRRAWRRSHVFIAVAAAPRAAAS